MRGAVSSLPHTFMTWYLTNLTLVSDVYEDQCLLGRDLGAILVAESE
jgi:hypothetical protein